MMRFGKYNPDNSVAIEADVCVWTGHFVDASNSVREPVTGTPYFYRVCSGEYRKVTDELRKQWHSEASAQDRPIQPTPPRQALVKSEE